MDNRREKIVLCRVWDTVYLTNNLRWAYVFPQKKQNDKPDIENNILDIEKNIFLYEKVLIISGQTNNISDILET